jgi:hypothetical protein
MLSITKRTECCKHKIQHGGRRGRERSFSWTLDGSQWEEGMGIGNDGDGRL